jgi:serine kinase of HPr protein (carbohydrate metabolism regulator)
MMMDMRCIVFVRSKRPTPEMVALANENRIAVLVSNYRMYEACGKLYANASGTRHNAMAETLKFHYGRGRR